MKRKHQHIQDQKLVNFINEHVYIKQQIHAMCTA